MSVENPIPDYIDVVEDREYVGLAWIPTVLLRFVEREEEVFIDPHHTSSKTGLVLQQMWETAVMNQSGALVHVFNPSLTQWRDVETVAKG
jgi:hypothetical protein